MSIIYMDGLNLKRLVFQVNLQQETVASLQLRIYEATGFAPERFRLLYKGKMIESNLTSLCDLGLSDGSALRVHVPLTYGSEWDQYLQPKGLIQNKLEACESTEEKKSCSDTTQYSSVQFQQRSII